MANNSVQIKVKGAAGYEFYNFQLDKLPDRDTLVSKLKTALTDLVFGSVIDITDKKLYAMARAMSAAGNQEFALLAPFIQQHMLGHPNSPGATTTISFGSVDALDSNFDSKFTQSIIPSTAPNRLRAAKQQSNTLIWRALKKKYWEAKGQKGFFDNTGRLRTALSTELYKIPETVGPLKVSFDKTRYNGETTVDKKQILGYFRITYVKQRYYDPAKIPALTPGVAPGTIDKEFLLEKTLFGDNDHILKKLGVYADGSKKSFTPRHMVQPALSWFLMERTPVAMGRAADRILRA